MKKLSEAPHEANPAMESLSRRRALPTHLPRTPYGRRMFVSA